MRFTDLCLKNDNVQGFLFPVINYAICDLDEHFLDAYVLNICKINFRSLTAIGNGCKQLKNLTLSDCYFMGDKGLEAIATGCSELTHLEVNGCHNIGTHGLASIGKSCLYVSLSLDCSLVSFVVTI